RSPPAIPTPSWYWPTRRARLCRRTHRARSGVRSARCASGVSWSSPAPCSGGRARARRRPWRSCGGVSRPCHDPVARPRPRRRPRLRAGGAARARPRPARPAGFVRPRALAAFVGALAAMALVYRLGLVGGAELDPRVLILAGVAVGAFASAVTTAIVSLSEAAQLRNTFLWLWGGLSGASWDTVLVVCVYFPLPVAVLLAAARPLDLLALGEEPARHLGADVEPLRRRVYLAASLLTAAAVAVSGVIGFVGLIVPHAMRLLWGHRHRSLLPASFLAGGALLALADTTARVAVAPRELPVGIVTALVGVPLFALMLRRWTAS